ncbi:MAG: JmjC domain-containing protein [Gemmataceae bacterium]
MMLAKLLGEMPVRDFMANHYQRFPFARAGGCTELFPENAWTLTQTILDSNVADVLFARGNETLKAAPGINAAEMVSQGYTLRVRHAERHDAHLQTLAHGFHADFLAPVDVHLYCTPGNHEGLNWHYDAEEVFVLQLDGIKEWSLRKNTVHPWPLVETIPENMRVEREISPTMRCTLQPGDWLYVPNGYWHRTKAGPKKSISLSVGILAPSAIDLLDFVRRRLVEDLRWRQRLPSPHDGDVKEQYRTLAAELSRDLAEVFTSAAIVEAYLKDRRGRD